MSIKDGYSVRRKVLQMVEVGFTEDALSRSYDIVNMAAIIINLIVTLLFTFSEISAKYSGALSVLEIVTVIFFLIDYILRLWTAPLLFPDLTAGRAVAKYAFSFMGIIDILSFLPFFLPVFFPAGVIAFRMLRVVRIFRLFRINAYYDSLSVITEVLKSKKQQLASSVFIVLLLMLAASLCMYSVENAAQPDVFENAFSGIWWSVSTLLTVGYGDIYPITIAGRILSIIITFLGVGMVAIPTGIISAGFVEQYTKLREVEETDRSKVHFIKIFLHRGDVWTGKRIDQLILPGDMIIAAVQRGEDTIVPRGDVILKEDDIAVLAAKGHADDRPIELQEILIKDLHPWNGMKIKDLDISRQTFIVMIQRDGISIVPSGDLELKSGDNVVLYTKKFFTEAIKNNI